MFPVLQTPRLTLREIKEEDADALYALRSDPEVTIHTGVGHGSTEESRAYILRLGESYAAGKDIFWAIAPADEPGNMMGGICFWDRQADGSMYIGYELAPTHWGRGYMGEALARALAYAFGEMNIPAVLADPREENHASIALLERAGFALVDSSIHRDAHGVDHRHLLYRKNREAAENR